MSSDEITEAPIKSVTPDEFVGKTLLEQLPGIVAAGKRKAEAILDRAQNESKIDIQNRELVIPDVSKDNLIEKFSNGN